jgi:hypothetical protein
MEQMILKHWIFLKDWQSLLHQYVICVFLFHCLSAQYGMLGWQWVTNCEGAVNNLLQL